MEPAKCQSADRRPVRIERRPMGSTASRKDCSSHKSNAGSLRQRLGNEGVRRMMGEVTGQPIQAKLSISEPGDAHEREADRVADAVMRMPGQQVHRKCADCENKEEHDTTPHVQRSIGGGVPLDRDTRAFMEPRFGQNFADVRIHTGEQAARSAAAIGAEAYTIGRDVVFGAGRHAPQSSEGRKLIAHELTHVVQQGESGAARISRTASPVTFNCPANSNNAPASPFGDIDAVDRNAQGLASATSIFATLSALFDPSTSGSTFDTAYRDRFGPPAPVGTKFRNRFTGRLLDSAQEAAQQEVTVVGNRLERIADFLGGPIRYTCHTGGVAFNHSNCTSTCSATDVAYSCVPNDLRRIEICPHFWDLASDRQAIGIIHEAGHMLFNFGGHGSASLAQRGNNPECYASLVADSFGIAPFDTRCPVI